VTITGTNLASSTKVTFGATAATIVSDNATSIVATSPAESAATVDVEVTTPSGTSSAVSADKFTYETAPTVTGISPTSGPTTGGTVVTVTGTNFYASSTTSVDFGGVAASNVSVSSSTQLTATSPAGSIGTVNITVTTPAGTSATGSSDDFVYTSPSTGSAYVPLTPYRICDTRAENYSGLSGTDNQCLGKTVGAGGTLTIQVTGTNPTGTSSGGVPASGVTAVVLNVTVVNPSASSWMTVWPAGTTQPVASNLNFVPGQTVPNLVTVALPASGEVSLYNTYGSTDVVVDVEGYYAAPSGTAGLFNPLTPYRICDTRAGNPSGLSGTDNQCLGETVGAGGTLTIQVTGTNPSGTSSGGVPASGVSAVVLNVTVTNPSASSWMTVWPAGASQPVASNLNFVPGETVANRVMVPVSSSGQVSLYNTYGSTDVVVDVNGWFTNGSSNTQTGDLFTASSPSRICDTRPTYISGLTDQCTGETIGAGGTLSVAVEGQGSVPASGVTAAVVNVTVTDTSQSSYLTAWPAGATLPVASDLNWVAGDTVPNMAVVAIGTSGSIDLYNNAGSTDVVVDVMGWYTSG
jgi:hypothetical protein